MPVETATYISQLNTANPAHTDGLSAADSHMRLTKAALQATFPNFTAAALTSTQAQIDAAVAAVVTGASGQIKLPLSTVAAPALAFLGDLNTGLYQDTANTLAVAVDGVHKLLLSTTSLTSQVPFTLPAVDVVGAYSGGTGQLVPIGATLIWWDDVLPTEGGYAWANGQIIASANTVCPVLLARWGTRFGGNGLTTMGVPDLRDTVPVGKSTMGAVASRALQTLTNTVLGTLIGAANVVLGIANLPTITSVNAAQAITVTTTQKVLYGPNSGSAVGGGTQITVADPGSGGSHAQLNSTGNNSISVTSSGTSNNPVNNVQPSTTCNYIIRLA